MDKPVDRWPTTWKRPLYGPDVVARRLVAAGHALLEGSEPMASKTVEEAFEEWSDKPEAEAATRHELFKKCYAAGAAHGAVEEREAVLAIVEAIKMTAKFGYQTDLIAKVEARIRQRGEK